VINWSAEERLQVIEEEFSAEDEITAEEEITESLSVIDWTDEGINVSWGRND
jgi:hypothetical protein